MKHSLQLKKYQLLLENHCITEGSIMNWAITSSVHRIGSNENSRKEEILKTINFVKWLKTKDGIRTMQREIHKSKTNLSYWAIAAALRLTKQI